MKILSEKEGGFYNNKILVVSVLVLIILAMVVYATIYRSHIVLSTPGNASIDWNAGMQAFNCSASSGGGAQGVTNANITLFTNFSGVWANNGTRYVTGFSSAQIYNITINLSKFTDFVYGLWTCEFNGSELSSNFSAYNHTFSLDITPPSTFNLSRNSTSYSNNNTVVSGAVNSHVILNWTATTEDHFINYTVFVYNSTTYNNSFLVAVNKTTTITTTNVNVTHLLGGNFADDTYYWYVRAYENQSAAASRTAERNSTQRVMQFVIDTGLSVATLIAPANDTWDSDGSVMFNYTVQDANPHTCTIYYNVTTASYFIANQSNSSLSEDDVVFPNTAVALSDGNYTWYVWCNDTGGNQGNSTQKIIKMDNTDPVVNLESPTAGGYSTDTSVTFNFNTSEVYPLNCSLYTNRSGSWELNQTLGYNNNQSTSFTTVTFPSNGTYTWNVYCNDSAGNLRNASNRTLYIDDDGAPTMSLVAPAHNTYSSVNYTTFNYTANDIFLDTCILYGNFSGSWATNKTNSTLANGSTVADWVNLTSLNDTVYIWNAWCNDSAANEVWLNTTGNYTLTVDTLDPSNPLLGNVLIGGVPYGNNTLGSVQTPTVNWTIVTEINFANYTIQFANGTAFAADNISNQTKVTTRTTTNVTIGSGLLDNVTYWWRVIAHDLAGNSNTSGWYNYTTDFTDPVAIPNQPSSLTITSYKASASVAFNYTLTEVNPDTCALWGNFSGTWKQNQTNTTLGSERTRFTIASATLTLGNGTYSWNVYCNDSAKTPNTEWANSTTNFTLIVDTATPTIGTSINGTTTSSRVVTFTVTAEANTAINRTSIAVTPNASESSNLNYTNDCTLSGLTYTCSYIETGLTAGEPNLLNISADTVAGASATIYNLYITPLATYNFTIALKSGWNLISTPLILESSSVGNMVANNSKIDSIHWYDLSASTYDVWFSDSSYTDTLTTMEPRKGYWVNATADTNIYLFGRYWTAGVPDAYDGLTLAAGWHTIGQYKITISDGFNTSQVLSNLVTSGYYDFSSLSYWDASNQLPADATQSRYVDGSTGYAIDGVWDRGRAFWIYTTTSHVSDGGYQGG